MLLIRRNKLIAYPVQGYGRKSDGSTGVSVTEARTRSEQAPTSVGACSASRPPDMKGRLEDLRRTAPWRGAGRY